MLGRNPNSTNPGLLTPCRSLDLSTAGGPLPSIARPSRRRNPATRQIAVFASRPSAGPASPSTPASSADARVGFAEVHLQLALAQVQVLSRGMLRPVEGCGGRRVCQRGCSRSQPSLASAGLGSAALQPPHHDETPSPILPALSRRTLDACNR